MTFEEFFKKKRIDLAGLEVSEPGLFSEFKTHFEQMGEKSFDHTKKYWFNKIRRQYPLAPEIKAEKIHAANPVAEQTITESLIETPSTPSLPKSGYVPKFKLPGSTPKPLLPDEGKNEETLNPASEILPQKPADSESKAVYKPRFNMKNVLPKRAEE